MYDHSGVITGTCPVVPIALRLEAREEETAEGHTIS